MTTYMIGAVQIAHADLRATILRAAAEKMGMSEVTDDQVADAIRNHQNLQVRRDVDAYIEQKALSYVNRPPASAVKGDTERAFRFVVEQIANQMGVYFD